MNMPRKEFVTVSINRNFCIIKSGTLRIKNHTSGLTSFLPIQIELSKYLENADTIEICDE